MNMPTLEEVNRQGRERLYPSLTNPSWLILSARREIFRSWLARLNGDGLRVLDVGGRIQPYRPLIEGRLKQYVAVDLGRTPLVNIHGRGEQLPLASGEFDLVVCTQVLEYVFDPAAVISEMHRVLKPGGCLLLSVPSVWPRDSKSEYWRFLPAGIERMLGGFSNVEIVAEGGSVTGFFRSVNACLDIFVRYSVLRWIFRHTLCPLLNLSGIFLERVAGSSNDQFAANYSALARK